MTAVLAEPTATPSDVDDDITHTTCCDDNVAICGEDVSAAEWVEGRGDKPCPMCELAIAERWLCPAFGCRLWRLLGIRGWRGTR